MTRLPAVALMSLLLIAFACDTDDETVPDAATPTPDPATATAQPTPPDEDCRLASVPTSTASPDLSWNGWQDVYDWPSIEAQALQATAIVRGVVLAEATTEVDWGLNQVACVWLIDVYRGDGLASGDIVTVVWPAPRPIDSYVKDLRVGYRTGDEYILLLQPAGPEAYDLPLSADYRTWLRDVYPTSTSGVGAAPSPDHVSQLIALVEGARDVLPLLSAELADRGLEFAYGVNSERLSIPPLPNAAGTLTSNSAQNDFLWRTTYVRIRDALTAGGYDWEEIAAAPAFVLSGMVRPIGSTAPDTPWAAFVIRDGAIIGAFISTYPEGHWTIDQYEAASAAHNGPSISMRQNVPAQVNLLDWFDTREVVAIRYKGGDNRIGDSLFLEAPPRDAFLAALDRTVDTHPIGPSDSVGSDCDETGFNFERADGWAFGLRFEASTNRLYAVDDGFWVDAGPDVPALLGIEPHSTGACFVPQPKP